MFELIRLDWPVSLASTHYTWPCVRDKVASAQTHQRATFLGALSCCLKLRPGCDVGKRDRAPSC